MRPLLSLCAVAIVLPAALLAACGSDEPTTSAQSPGNAGTTSEGGDAGSSADQLLPGDSPQESADAPGSPDADGSTCPLAKLSFGAACDACMAKSCCTTATTCDKNPSCTALVACATACPPVEGGASDPCRQACGAKDPGGISDYNALVLCLGNGCLACPF
jgi:hypothetical protein